MFVVLGTINPSTFQTSYDNFIATNNATLTNAGYGNLTTYTGTINAAGITPPAGMLLASLAAFPLAWYSYTWYTLPSVWAGEMKQARRSMPITIVGAVLFIGAYFILFLFLTIHAFGQPFLTAWSSLAYTAGYPLPGTVNLYVPFFAYLVYHDPILMWMMFIALILPDIMAFPPLIIATTRYLFSWSFDRILPESIARVSMRTNTPIYASLIALVVSVFGAAIQSFASSSTPGVIVPIFTFGYILPAITGIVFPFLRKDLYEGAFMFKRKIAGLPTITWLGIASLIALIIGTYALLNPSLDTGGLASFKFVDYVFYAVAYGVGIAIFLVAWAARKKQGVELSLAFAEIPPE
jgi:amino acid transporter